MKKLPKLDAMHPLVWHVLTFLRGPDQEFECAGYIKDLTTARVRERAGLHQGNKHGVVVAHADDKILPPERIKQLITIKFAGRYTWRVHHRTHYEQAVDALDQLGLLRPGDWLYNKRLDKRKKKG